MSSIVLVAGVFRHREIFDAIVRVRESTTHLLEAMHRGLVTFDQQGATILCNDPAVTLLGKRPANRDDLDPEIRELFPTGGQRYTKRGAKILKTTVLHVEAPVKEASYSHLLIEDSTEEYRMLHEFSQRESLASLGEAATTLAHEIRNPLAAMSITVDAMERTEQVERVRVQIRRLNAFIQDRLDFARPVVPDMEACDLNRLLQKIGKRSPLPARLDLAERLPSVHADPDMLGQIFDNLIRNADEAGAKSVEIATAQNGKQVSVRIFNEGPPIAPDILGRLFEPFFTTKETGSGIGLALSKKILTAHGGDITARNVERGVEFEVRLPWTS
jgi:signal transduction histidine kinase